MTIIGTLLNDQKFSYEPIWKQEAKDSLGRKRFHGAFTGGFIAGYHNTVGSKEGWTPATFKSSRGERAFASGKMTRSTIQDFMDEEDYNFEELVITYKIKNIGWKLLGLNPLQSQSYLHSSLSIKKPSLLPSDDKEKDSFIKRKRLNAMNNNFDEDELDIYNDNFEYTKFIMEDEQNNFNQQTVDKLVSNQKSMKSLLISSSDECIFKREPEILDISLIISSWNNIAIPEEFISNNSNSNNKKNGHCGLELFDPKSINSSSTAINTSTNINTSTIMNHEREWNKTEIKSSLPVSEISDRFIKGKYDLGINDEYSNNDRSGILMIKTATNITSTFTSTADNNKGETKGERMKNEKNIINNHSSSSLNQKSKVIEKEKMPLSSSSSSLPTTDRNTIKKWQVDWIPNEMLCKRLNVTNSFSHSSHVNNDDNNDQNTRNDKERCMNEIETKKPFNATIGSNRNNGDSNSDKERREKFKEHGYNDIAVTKSNRPSTNLFRSIFGGGDGKSDSLRNSQEIKEFPNQEESRIYRDHKNDDNNNDNNRNNLFNTFHLPKERIEIVKSSDNNSRYSQKTRDKSHHGIDKK